jgi:hypothetical protein
MMFSQFNDNVKSDDLYPRIYTYQGQGSYMYNGFEAFPIGVSLQKSILKSTDEPEFSFPLKEDTDSVSGTLSYASGPLNIGVQAGFSHQDDRTEQNNDSDAVNYSLSSSYRFQNLCVTPSASFNRAKYRQTGGRTDTTTATLDLRGRLWEDRFNYEGAGTYTRTETNDHSVKQDGYNARFRLAYRIAQDLWGLSEPSAGIMGNYSMNYDYVNNLKNRELVILVVFSTSVPVVF